MKILCQHLFKICTRIFSGIAWIRKIIINVLQSMISKTLLLIEGKPIDSHSLIKTIFNGCFNLNPPKPKYNLSWDPKGAITFIASLGDNPLLRFTVLSRRTVVLLALASLLRVSELVAINLLSQIMSKCFSIQIQEEPTQQALTNLFNSIFFTLK